MISPPQKKREGSNFNFLNEKKKKNGIDLTRVSGPTLHKYYRDIIYYSRWAHIPSQEGKHADIVEW